MAIVIAMILIAGWVGWWYLERVKPEGQVTEAVPFTVIAGDNVDTLAARLQQQGFVEDASVFTWYVGQHGGLEIVPGYYQLRHNDHMGNILGRLRTSPDRPSARSRSPKDSRCSRWPTGWPRTCRDSTPPTSSLLPTRPTWCRHTDRPASRRWRGCCSWTPTRCRTP